MAEKYFQSESDKSQTKMTNFFQSVCTNSVSISLIERELSKEKIKRSTLDNDRREMKCKMKELVEKLNATEILIDISNAAIQVLEKAMKDSGSFNATAAASGTTIQFNPPIDTDTIKNKCLSYEFSTRLNCITCMKEYENKSLEELRMEDYAANHKGGTGSVVGIGFEKTTQNTGDLFGRNAAASTSGFSFSNTTQSKSMFDNTDAFGSSGGLFGQSVQTQNSGLFGKSAATPAFSFGASTGTSLFQQNNLQKPLFGRTSGGTGLIGSTATTQQSTEFGTNTAILSFCAKSQQKPLFSQTTLGTGFFGSTATTQQSTGFGTNTAILAFGAKSPQATGLFGAKPTGFGSTNTTTTPNSFSFGNTNALGGGSGLFGQKPADTAIGTRKTAFGALSSGFVQQNTPVSMSLFSSASKPTCGFGDLFKPKEGTWECKSCYVRNSPDETKCVCCVTPNSSSAAAKQSTPSTMSLFSSASMPTCGFGDLFKPKEGTWECKSCYVRNSPDKAKCVCCDTENDMSSSTKPASTLFGTSGSSTLGQAYSFGSLSSQFGGSPQKSQTVFGSATTGFSFKDSKTESGFFSGVAPLESKENQDVEVVYESLVLEEKVKLAEKLQLPICFFLYENKPSCPGCIGCENKIPPYKTTKPQESVEKNPTSDTNATPKSSTVTQESSTSFSSSSFSTFSFRDTAIDFEKLSKSPEAGKVVCSGARTSLSQNLNTSAEDGTDEVAPNPDIHFEPAIPLPDLIEVKTGEEDEASLFIFHSKLFRYDPNTKQWKERGIGDIKILSHKEKMRFRIILRRDKVHNVACNHCITEEMSLTPLSTSENALCWTAMDFSDGKIEATQFAVRFKHKEQTQQFKEVFLDCQEKLRNCKQTSVEEKVATNAQNAEPVSASGGASAAEESVTEDEEEESEELIFEKRVTLEVFDDAENKFKVEGMGYLKIVYDDSSFGYRVFMEADDDRLLCEHLIAVQTCLRTDGKTAIWAAIDYCMEPVTRRQFRVTFSSMEALNEFSKHFEEGKEIAIKSPIVEKSD